MTVRTNSAEGGTNGVAVTPANSGGASGNAFDSTQNVVFDSSVAAHGALSFKCTSAVSTVGGQDNFAALRYTGFGPTAGRMAARCYFRMSVAPAPVSQSLIQFYDTSDSVFSLTTVASLAVTTARKLFVYAVPVGSTTPITFWTSTAVLALNTWYRLELSALPSTAPSTGVIHAAVYSGDSTTPLDSFDTTTANNSNLNTSTVVFAPEKFSIATVGTDVAWIAWLDDIGLNQPAAEVGPYVALSTGATQASTFSATATGRVGKAVGATRTSTFTATPTGGTGNRAAAMRTETFTATAAAVLGKPVGAARAETFTATATGRVGVRSGAALPLTFAGETTGASAAFGLYETVPAAGFPPNAALMYAGVGGGDMSNTQAELAGLLAGDTSNAYMFRPRATNTSGAPEPSDVTPTGWLAAEIPGTTPTQFFSTDAGRWAFAGVWRLAGLLWTGSFRLAWRAWRLSADQSARTLVPLPGADGNGWLESGVIVPGILSLQGPFNIGANVAEQDFSTDAPYLWIEAYARSVTPGILANAVSLNPAVLLVPSVTLSVDAAATQPSTFTATATGTVGGGQAGARPEVFATVATGAVDQVQTSGALRPEVFTVSAAGMVDRPAAATVAESFTTAATGHVGVAPGSALRAETFSAVAVGAVGVLDLVTGAARPELFTAVASGVVGAKTGVGLDPDGVIRLEVFTAVASGLVAEAGEWIGLALRPQVFLALASGSVLGSSGAVVEETFATVASGVVASAECAPRQRARRGWRGVRRC